MSSATCASGPPSRDPTKAKSYDGKLWKKELEHVLLPMLDKYGVVPVDDADRLIDRAP